MPNIELPTGFTEHFYQTKHVKLNAIIGGTGNTPLFLLAGWPQTAMAWRLVLPELAKHFRIYAINLRGQGSSQIIDGPYDTLSMSSDIKEVADQLGYEKVMVVGHDVGAWVAFTYAKYFQQNVLGLGLLDAAIPGLNDESFFTLENAKKVWQFYFHINLEIAELLIKDREVDYLNWYFQNKSVIKNNLNSEITDYYIAEYTKANAMKAGLRWYQDVPISQKQIELKSTETLTMPVLALGGESATGLLIHNALQSQTKSLIGGSLPNCGHYLPEEQPVIVAEWIIKLKTI
jgi:pimeloyl-ACP methyl ester carboxylesterase